MSYLQSSRFLSSLILTAALVWGAQAAYAEQEAIPEGTYKLDPRHTSITFKLSHLGFSHFTGRFDHVEGSLDFKPTAPEETDLNVTIYPASIDTNDTELDDDLIGENWFDALKFPRASFHATKIEPTGDHTAKIIGDFTLHGVTHTLTLDTILVGAGTMPMTGEHVIGFSASGVFNRSDYGISNLAPLVGDEVTLQIESEWDKDKDGKDQE